MKVKERNIITYQQDKDLIEPINDWLAKNPGFNKSRLINMAIRSFITKEQKLIPVETVSNEKAIATAKQMMKKHADMLKKLK